MSTWPGAAPLGVAVDLDDTLYAQADYLAGAVQAVGARAGQLGVKDRGGFETTLAACLAEGSDKGNTIDRALADIGLSQEEIADMVAPLVRAFVDFRPQHLDCFPGAREALEVLKDHLPVVCVTDGDPSIQRAKLAALDLTAAFTAVIVTDELGGRAMRKPHPAGMIRAAGFLGAQPSDLIVVGDRPDKDVAAAAACHAQAIRIRQGEYTSAPDLPLPWASTDDFPSAVRLILAILRETRDSR